MRIIKKFQKSGAITLPEISVYALDPQLQKQYKEARKNIYRALYGMARFTPYIKYITDIGDTFGYDVGTNTFNRDLIDLTDLAAAGGNGIRYWLDLMAADERRLAGKVTRYRGWNRRRTYKKHTLKEAEELSKAGKLFSLPFRAAGLIGDIIQSGRDIYNMYRTSLPIIDNRLTTEELNGEKEILLGIHTPELSGIPGGF